MNLVALIGNVATEPSIRYTPTGRAVCTFRIAVARPGGDEADYFTVVTWERQAEVCAQYVTRGRRVGIEGRLHLTTPASDGEPGRVEVVASRVNLLGAVPDAAKV